LRFNPLPTIVFSMENKITIWLIIVLVSGIAVGCSAGQRSFDFVSGKLAVSFYPDSNCLSASYGGVFIIRNSSLWVHNPAWNHLFYGYNQIKDPIEIRNIEGGQEAVITHKNDDFIATQWVTIRGNTFTVRLKFKLARNIPDADLEYCLGTFCAAPITGRPFSAVTEKDVAVNGILPVYSHISDPFKCQITPDPFKKLHIDSRIGGITIEASGNPNTLFMMDYRRNLYEAADVVPVFWSGMNQHLEYGKEYDQAITITITPPVNKPLPVVTPTSIEAKVNKVSNLRTAHFDPVYIIPEPQKMKLTNEAFTLDADTRIVVSNKATSEDLLGARSFAYEVKLLYGLQLKVIHESDAAAGNMIMVGEASSNKLLATAAAEEFLRSPAKEEGYALKVTGNCVLVLGSDRKGTYYGMQTLKQLVRADTKRVFISGCLISDWPSLKYRGLHLFTGNKALPFHQKLMDRILARYKMNQLVLEVDFLKWNTDPSIAMTWAEDQSDITKEIAYAKDHFIEINPLLQSLGHCDWLFSNGRNKNLAENPDLPYAYCPTKPGIYDYIFKFYDETIKLFNNPKFVHIGHDEVMEPGGFPRDAECKKRSAEQIFIDDTLKVRDHIAKSGSRIMMWGDMLLTRGDSPDATNADSQKSAKWMRAQLPKDVMIADWHYAPDKPEAYKSLKIFMDEGHDTVAATWFTPANIEAFSKQAKNVGALGLLQTTWAGFESSETNIRDSFNQFSAVILAAEYAWNNGKTSVDKLPYNWDAEFRKQWNPKPINLKGESGFTLDLTPACNIDLRDNGKGWMNLGALHDLSKLPVGESRFKGDIFRIAGSRTKPRAIRLASSLDLDNAFPESVEIGIGQKLKSLLFLHTCAWTDSVKRSMGAYIIVYTDGTSEIINLVYGDNIVAWTDKRALSDIERAWEGLTKDGEKISLQRLQWNNPYPDKQVKSIIFSSTTTESGPILVGLSAIQ